VVTFRNPYEIAMPPRGKRPLSGATAPPAPQVADEWMLGICEKGYATLTQLVREETFRTHDPALLGTLKDLVRTLAEHLDDGDDTQTERTAGSAPQRPRADRAAASPVPPATAPRLAAAPAPAPVPLPADALDTALEGMRLLSLGARCGHLAQALLADAALARDSRLEPLAAVLVALVPEAPAPPHAPEPVAPVGSGAADAAAARSGTRATSTAALAAAEKAAEKAAAVATALAAAQRVLATLPEGTSLGEVDAKALLGTWGVASVNKKQLTEVPSTTRASLMHARVLALRPLVDGAPEADATAQLEALKAWAQGKPKDALGLLLTERLLQLLEARRPGADTAPGGKALSREQLVHMCDDLTWSVQRRGPKRARAAGGGSGGESDDDNSEDEKSDADVGEQGRAAGLYDEQLAAAGAKAPPADVLVSGVHCPYGQQPDSTC
jgi:hypothetical protein